MKRKNIYKRFFLMALPLLVLLHTACFKHFIKTDEDIAAHYKSKPVKPEFRECLSGGRCMHYAKISIRDTLPLVVFIHGAPGAWYGYMNLMDDSLLQQHARLISVDRPGYGKSNYGKLETSMEKQASLIAEVIRENKNNRKVILVGRSYGSPVAARIAMDYPGLVDGLLLQSSAVDPAKEKFFWFSPAGRWSIFRFILPRPINMATDEKYSHVAELSKLTPLWQSIKVPSILMQGEQDDIVDPANAQFLDSVLVNSPHTLIRLPEENHFISYHKPWLIREAILQLLDGNGKGAVKN